MALPQASQHFLSQYLTIHGSAVSSGHGPFPGDSKPHGRPCAWGRGRIYLGISQQPVCQLASGPGNGHWYICMNKINIVSSHLHFLIKWVDPDSSTAKLMSCSAVARLFTDWVCSEFTMPLLWEDGTILRPSQCISCPNSFCKAFFLIFIVVPPHEPHTGGIFILALGYRTLRSELHQLVRKW